MAVLSLTNFIRITDVYGNVQGRYQNGQVGKSITLEGQSYSFLSFLYSGAARNRTGDNLEAAINLASNALSMSITTQAVRGKWRVEVISCSMNPTSWEVGKVLNREYWLAASQSYDPTQVEVILSSGIDAVGASGPTQVLTSKRVGRLPVTGAIQNL
jgi:hypothetical protein